MNQEKKKIVLKLQIFGAETCQENNGFTFYAVHLRHLVIFSDQNERCELLPGVLVGLQTAETAIASATGGTGVGAAKGRSI